jgi:hypothetical protein
MAVHAVSTTPSFYTLQPALGAMMDLEDLESTVANVTCNISIPGCLPTNNITMVYQDQGDFTFEAVVKIVVPIIFSLIAILGFAGNMLVIIVVSFNHQMRNTTNILILNLAIADLFFSLICVPFTAMVYSMSTWPFGSVWCKIYQ